MMARAVSLAAVLTITVGLSVGGHAEPGPPVQSDTPRLEELWRAPQDIASLDLFDGPWGHAFAPHPSATFRFQRSAPSGGNPGMLVTDPAGREWNVKQAPHDGRPGEGPVEVVLSRVLSAVGYHQPPVYYLPRFTLADTFGSRNEPGGRFRLNHPDLRERATWDWQKNPFTDTQPYRGLVVMLIMFNAADLKNANTSVYEHTVAPGVVERWYVARDIGAALGATSRINPRRGDPDQFAAVPFVTGTYAGFVRFGHAGWREALVRDRITAADVRWACGLLAQLTKAQWQDAFRAGGYEGPVAARFIQRLREKIAEGLAISPA
jgi:hypothetical protein